MLGRDMFMYAHNPIALEVSLENITSLLQLRHILMFFHRRPLLALPCVKAAGHRNFTCAEVKGSTADINSGVGGQKDIELNGPD
jgi:hypothetical protein